MRIFVAIKLSQNILDQLSPILLDFKEKYRDVRWIPIENLHITLAFFQELDEEGIQILEEVIIKSLESINNIKFSTEKIIYIPIVYCLC